MSMEFRPMLASDIPDVAQLMRDLDACGAESDPRYQLHDGADSHYERMCHDEWLGVFSPYPMAWVAVDGEVCAGFIQGSTQRADPMIVSPPGVHIRRVFVSEAHRRKGLGRELVTRFMKATSDAGFTRTTVTTLGLDTQAQAFWASIGFGPLRVILSRDDAPA